MPTCETTCNHPHPSLTAGVLIVEDEFVLALSLKEQIKEFGYNVVGIAATSDQAWEMAVQFRPDVVLMDIHLQGADDGIAAATRIRQTLKIPVIYVTAHTDGETLTRAQITYPSGYLTKPVRPPELRANLAVVLYQREQATHPASKPMLLLESRWQWHQPQLFAGLDLLIVEGDEVLQALYADCFSPFGARVRTTGTIATALALLEQAPVDVIVSELALLDGIGQDLLQQVRKQERALKRPPAPMLAVSVQNHPALRQAVLAAGFADYLVKPIGPAILQSTIVRLAQLNATQVTSQSAE